MKYFVEIGSSDFDTLIPLCELGWKGVCIEPVEYLAQNLEREIKAKGYPVEVLNHAVSYFDGEAELVQVDKFDYGKEGDWTRGVSHLSSNHNDGQWCGRLLERINHIIPRKYVNVPCRTLNSVINYLRNESVVFRGFNDTIDFLRVDAEGQEVNILKGYDWSVRPKLMKVEHRHCDINELLEIVKKQKYFIQKEDYDIYCLQ